MSSEQSRKQSPSLLLAIFLTAVSLFTSARAWATNDVVFDLDQTLIYETTRAMADVEPGGIIEVEGKIYRFADHALDLLVLVHQLPEARVSYFSGGPDARNRAVVAEIYKEVDRRAGRGRYHHHVILSRDALTPQKDVEPDAKFWQRYKKDLGRYFDVRSAVLVDDLKGFVPESQAENLLWIGVTYNDRPKFSQAQYEDPALKMKSAPSEIEWKREREKLVRVAALLTQATNLVRERHLGFVAALSQALKAENRATVQTGLELLDKTHGPLRCQLIFARENRSSATH